MEKFKLFFIALGTALTARMGLLATPVYLLVGLGVLDYLTGIAAAPQRGQTRSSLAGLRGIVKKISILLVVALAAVVDWVLLYAARWIGLTLPFTFLLASATAVWLICNEVLSILENIGDLGVDLPPFLARAVRWLKKSAEEQAAPRDDDPAEEDDASHDD